MALSLSPMASPKKKKPVTLQMEQQAVAKPVALQQNAPTPPREAAPATPAIVAPPSNTTPASTVTQTGLGATPSWSGSWSGPATGGAPATGVAGGSPMVGGFVDTPSWSGSWSGPAIGGGSNIDVTGPGTRGDTNQNGIPDEDEEGYDPFRGWDANLPPGWKLSEIAAWSDATGGAVRAPRGTPDEPASNEELNNQIRSLMEDLVAGRGMDVSTAEEEALIRELMQDRLGAGLVEQRARMGRAGFGASGALAAMEGDIRRQAGQQATQETLAIRRQAEQEAIDNALRAIGVDIGVRGEARRAAFDQEFLDALKSYLGQGGDVGGGEGGGEGSTAWLNTGWGEGSTLAASGTGDAGMDSKNPIITQSAPQGSRLIQDSPNVGGKLYLGPDGLYYLVEA